MAEAFLRKLAGDRFEVFSAGLRPEPIHPLTRQVMEEVGIDLSGHRSKGVKEYLVGMSASYLIVVCDRAERDCPHYMPNIHERLFWPFNDPAVVEGPEEERVEAFRDVRDQIEARILDWLSAKENPGQSREAQGQR